MAYIEWNDTFDVGVPSINKEHQALINYVNELHSGLHAGFGIADMGYILNGLVKYTQVHFKHEEEMMNKHNYPNVSDHIKEHNALINEVLIFKEQFDQGKKSFSIELLVFLRDWLINHIQGSDMKYKNFFSENGITV
jgi:hemerythrin